MHAADESLQATEGDCEGYAAVSRSGIPTDRLIAILLDVGLPLVGDGSNGLVPGNPLPFATAAFAHSAHGVLDAVGVVNALRQRHALETDAVVLRVKELSIGHAHELAVAHVQIEKAALIAVAATGSREVQRFGAGGCQIVAAFAFFFRIDLRSASGQSAEHAHRANDSSRALKEGAPSHALGHVLLAHILSPSLLLQMCSVKHSAVSTIAAREHLQHPPGHKIFSKSRISYGSDDGAFIWFFSYTSPVWQLCRETVP